MTIIQLGQIYTAPIYILHIFCTFNKIHNHSCFIVHNHVQYCSLLNEFTDEVNSLC